MSHVGENTRKIKLVINLNYSKDQVTDIIRSRLKQLPVTKKERLDDIPGQMDNRSYGPETHEALREGVNPPLVKASLRVLSSGQNATDVVIELEDKGAPARGQVLDIAVLRQLAWRIFERFFKRNS